MPLTAPLLDDRRYADIVRDAKALIPRYTPEWTDHNPSDPGITLIELYAWMTDMLLYRVNQVPERHYIKFLQLLGAERRPAAPARAELTFTLARPDLDHVIVPDGTRVAVGGATGPGGAPVVFETDEALIALGASLLALQSFDGVGHRVVTEANATAGQSFLAFGPAARAGSALMLGFETPVAMTSQQLHLAVTLAETGLLAEGRHCDLDINRTPPPARLIWEVWDGATWQPLGVDRDDTRALTRSGHVYLRGPGAAAKRAQLGQVEALLYWIRVRLAAGDYELPPRLASVLTNTVRATQATTLRHEVLGGSDGRPNQTVQLSAAPVLVRDRPDTVRDASGRSFQVTSLRLEVDEGQGFSPWREVDDFYASGPDDADFTLNRATGEIAFGDGRHGRMPLSNPAAPANIVAREYRSGGGAGGNAGVGTVTDLQASIAGVQGVTNLTPATGGTDEEPIAETKLRAAREVKAKDRAVTAEDFELLAQGTPGARVRRAKALPLRHPAFGEVPIPGVVSVIVVPDTPDPAPRPNETTLRLVCAHLNTHRLLTTEVHVVPPAYRKVRIEADVIVRADGDLAEVKRGVEDALTAFLHPLTGGDDGTGWPFGFDIFFSKVYRVILGVPGVDRVRDGELFIWVDDERQIFCRDVPIGTGALTYSVGHDIRVAYPGSV